MNLDSTEMMEMASSGRGALSTSRCGETSMKCVSVRVGLGVSTLPVEKGGKGVYEQ